MAQFDEPNVSIEKKTNEQNVQALKSCIINMQDTLSYYIDNFESRLEALESEES